MASHDLTVESGICAAAVTQNPPKTIPEQITEFAVHASGFAFNYGGHGELPPREDSMNFLLGKLVDRDRDDLWEGLTIENVGLNPAGVPFFQLVSPVTQRQLQLMVPCWGVVAWVKRLPETVVPVPTEGEPTAIGFTMINDDNPIEGWLKVRAVLSWCKSSLVLPGR